MSEYIIKNYIEDVKEKLGRYYDCILVDEFQDLSSCELNLFANISKNSNYDFIAVGDFYQKTFDSSRKGNINKNVYKTYDDFKEYFKEHNIEFNDKLLIETKRCNESVCSYIRKKLEIEIISNKDTGFFYDDFSCESKIKEAISSKKKFLFFNNSKNFHCNASNWGKSKGLTFDEVYVVISTDLYTKLNDGKLTEHTLRKLYIALTRATGNVYLVKKNIFDKCYNNKE